MTSIVFYERRKESKLVDFHDRRTVQRRKQEVGIVQDHRRLASQVRRYEREAFKIPIRLKLQDKEISGYTHDICPEGLLVFTDVALSPGAPMDLKFSFGENICHLNISGQVVFCHLSQEGEAPRHSIGIKFSGIRDFEKSILTSVVEELKQGPTIQEKSLLNILVSQDTLVQEVVDFSLRIPRSFEEVPGTIHKSCIHASKIIGWGSYLPDKEVTSSDINEILSAKGYKHVGDVVKHLTGIKTRRYVSKNQYPSDMAVQASRSALKNAGVEPEDLEVIIFCGVSRDVEEPATANIVREKIGAKNAYVFDLSNACNGFVSGIDVLDSFILSGRCEIGLVVAGEVMSQYITWEPHSRKDLKLSAMSYTFGDGGGAAVVCRVREGEEQGIRASWFLSDSSYWDVAVIPLLNGHDRLFKSVGSKIEDAALKHVPVGVEEIMRMLKWDISEIDLIIPHQVSSHIIKNLFYDRLGMPPEKVFWSFPRHGNVGAASMPVAVCEAFKEGQLKSGDKVLLVGGSGGFGVGIMGLIV